MKLRHLPLRLGAGAYILNSGLDKLSASDDAAANYHGMAANAYPVLKNVDPKTFTTVLAGTEVTLGAALLVPVLPKTWVAAGFTAFSAGLVGLYLRTPALHRGPGDIRPNPDGIGVAKDVIMLGAAAGFLLDTLGSKAKKAGKKASKKVSKQTGKVLHH
ncbi:DoxX family membrane protein [Cellulomonas denverensis]|uniref:DoxX family membrane protein n=1 Tax=Cellulomonas denverensis TaxID=264297 RepID=A0A7X6KT25_9CELL|nr:DoxX family membrane protein [Cellulomonas denverensis]NKY21781.1 DoxX family membrane protein [Cellulomonas denverensis]GIG25556.1 hypothetical protein Cde04nite_18000 [Cellulomonas denverensis]